ILCFTGDSGLTDYSVSLARAMIPYADVELITATSLPVRFSAFGFKTRLLFRRTRHYLLDLPRAFACILRERPTCVIQQGPLKFPLVEGFMARVLRHLGVPMILVVHDVLPHYPRRWSRWEFSHFYRCFDSLVVHSTAAYEQIRTLGVDSPILVVPHGSYDLFRLKNLSMLEARACLPGITSDDFVVLFFGPLEPRKGLSEFILVAKAMESVPGWKFVIAGNDEMAKHGEHYADLMEQAKNLSNVILVDKRIPFEAVESYFAASDVVALPYREGTTSGVLKLSIAFGVPVVASRVGDLPEQIPDGGGILFEADSDMVTSLQLALREVQRAPDTYRKGMLNASANCNWEQIAQAYIHFIFSQETARAAIA
ncbi:MAG: glycosyltransferase family 4 protein, partial [Deltaproteobacteria bacterium]|nr:glycosyltransferase family 4 protein [Deltaproteobacteria bacterium]